MKRLVWDDRALADLDAVADYIAHDSPGAAIRVVEDIQTFALLLEWSPFLGRTTGRPHIRSLVIKKRPYVLIYTIEGDEVRILSVVHQRRDRPRP